MAVGGVAKPRSGPTASPSLSVLPCELGSTDPSDLEGGRSCAVAGLADVPLAPVSLTRGWGRQVGSTESLLKGEWEKAEAESVGSTPGCEG